MNAPSIEQVKTYAAKLAGSAKAADGGKFQIDQKALHTYRSPDGLPLYWRMRLKCVGTGEKWIRPFWWNGEAFAMGEPPAPPGGKPLYGLEKLTALPDGLVIICEGESCADALNKAFVKWQDVGFVATTSGGAQSAAAADWQPLAGRHVFVWPDNDEQGAKYAADVVEALGGIAARVFVLNITKLNLPPKGDAVEWLQAGGTAEALLALTDSLRTQPPENLKKPDRLASSDIETEQSLPAKTDAEVIQWLASLNRMEYDRARTDQAKALGVRASILDAMVKEVRAEQGEVSRSLFTEVDPYPHQIDPAALLSDISNTIRRFIVLNVEQADAAALWVALTWFIEVIEVAPLAIINAPEKACGKSQLLTVIGRMACRPLPASNASASALFRAVELWKPTVLIDEADTFFRDNAELSGMVNAGHARDGYVLRSEAIGDTFEPRAFSVFSPKAIAGIALEKHLADATMSRGIVLNLRRKLPHETVDRLRYAEQELFAVITERLARFAADYSQQVRKARPTLPDVLSDRDQDNWDSLLAIASCAGAEWVDRATAAALKLSGTADKSVSVGNELLQDIQHVFESKRVDRISTADLIEALCADDEGAWATYNRGKPLTPRQLSKQLGVYSIASKNLKRGTYEVFKGFELIQFKDAFMRYLAPPSKMPLLSLNPLQANNGEGCEVADVVADKKSSGIYPLPPSISTENSEEVVAAVADSNFCRYLSATLEAPYSLGCSGLGKSSGIFEEEPKRTPSNHLRI